MNLSVTLLPPRWQVDFFFSSPFFLFSLMYTELLWVKQKSCLVPLLGSRVQCLLLSVSTPNWLADFPCSGFHVAQYSWCASLEIHPWKKIHLFHQETTLDFLGTCIRSKLSVVHIWYLYFIQVRLFKAVFQRAEIPSEVFKDRGFKAEGVKTLPLQLDISADISISSFFTLVPIAALLC